LTGKLEKANREIAEVLEAAESIEKSGKN